jgi:transposase
MDFLSLKNWTITAHEESEIRFLIYARYDFQALDCQRCSAAPENLYKHGWRTKTIRDSPVRGKQVLIKLSDQRYRCLSCKKTFTQKATEIADQTRITKRLIHYIEQQRFDETYLSVSRQTGVNENKIRGILMNYVNERQKSTTMPTPEVLGMDGVYVEREERLILTDIKNKRFIDLQRNVDGFNVAQNLFDLADKEKVKIVVMDMSKALKAAVRESLGTQIPIVIDKYHVQRMGNRAVSKFLQKIRAKFIKIRKSLSEEDRKQYFPDRFILQKRSNSLCDEKWEKLEGWGQNFPDLVSVYNLKEEFLQIWNYTERQKAEKAFDKWRDKIPNRLRNIFSEALTAFANWREEIFNYFEYPFTNAFPESTNNLIKMIKKQCRGASFETVRAKMLIRALDGLAEDEKQQPVLNNYRFVAPRKQQRVLQRQQGRLNTSKVFGLMFPKEPSFLDRFAPHIHLFYKNK